VSLSAKTFKDVHKGIVGVYHQVEAIINAETRMNISSSCDTFINHLNPEIERLNEEYHRVHSQ
jgi:hypothetical protein